MSLTPQQVFNERYITSAEIASELGVARSSVMHARNRGTLPNAICVNGSHIYIWEREKIQQYLEAWRLSLQARRGEL